MRSLKSPSSGRPPVLPQLKRAFTLIELLVVIAIIALLAAILFPVFSSARENARRASCGSNLKQLALGMVQYSQDYDEFTVPWRLTVSGGAVWYWNWAGCAYPYVKSEQIFQCPSQSIKNSLEDYTYNDSVGYQGATTSPRPLASVVLPSQTPMLADAYGGTNLTTVMNGLGVTDFTSPKAPCLTFSMVIPGNKEDSRIIDGDNTNWANYGDSSIAAIRHAGGANYAFVDGHVKWEPFTMMAGWNAPGSQPATYTNQGPPMNGMDYNVDGVAGTTTNYN